MSSSRDWKRRRLVTGHSQQKQGVPFDLSQRKDDLVTSIINGSHLRKHYSDVDYDSVLASIREKKEDSQSQSKRVQRLARHGKERKRAAILSDHRKRWLQKFTDLEHQVNNCQLELEQWRTSYVLNESTLQDFLLETVQLASSLLTERVQLQLECCEPVRLLRKELCRLKRRKLSGSSHFSRNAIMNEIERAKELLKGAWSVLEADWMLLIEQFQPIKMKVTSYADEKHVLVRGVAEEVWSLECPSVELRQAMSEEFVKLDTHYGTQLDKLDDRFKDFLCVSDGGWSSDEDQVHFELVHEQYSPNERLQCIDRIMTEMPHRKRQEIVNFEDWYCAMKHYHKQRELLETSWTQRRRELLERVRQCFAQACEDWNCKKLLEKEKQNHREVCKRLAQKVADWHQKCLAAQEAEAEIVAKKMSDQREQIEEEEKKECEKRKKIKHQLMLFHSRQQKAKEDEIAQEKERAEKLKILAEVQSVKDKERTEYRKHLYQCKLHTLAVHYKTIEKESAKREDRLENLRRLVRVEAAADPLRLHAQTESSKAHLLAAKEDLTNELFPLNSFSCDKVLADKRVKVADALREAGLLSTEYAQKVLASIPPPSQHRPDQKSSLFK